MKNLRLLRKEKKLMMKQLGHIIGLDESTISLYETGKREPSNDIINKLADFFNVSIDYLFGREEISVPSSLENTRSTGKIIDFDDKRLSQLMQKLETNVCNDSDLINSLIEKVVINGENINIFLYKNFLFSNLDNCEISAQKKTPNKYFAGEGSSPPLIYLSGDDILISFSLSIKYKIGQKRPPN